MIAVITLAFLRKLLQMFSQLMVLRFIFLKTCVQLLNVLLSIRYLKAQAGVNITASHNPREYNGYKAYWEDGAQVLAPHDKGIIDEVNKVKIEDVKFEGNKALIQSIGEDIDKLILIK